MQEEKSPKRCIACDRGSDEVPLFELEFRGGRFWICPQDLPTIIHQPAHLASCLPGAEGLSPAEHKD